MIIKREMSYQEKYLPTPRHKKLRTRTLEGEFTAEVAEASAADAPVVLRVHGLVRWADDFQPNDYRQYNGQLYVMARRCDYFCCSKERGAEGVTANEFADHLSVCGSYGLEHDVVAEEYRVAAADWLIIDGIAWRKAAEPYYYVQTFGLGNNHGGTGLIIHTDHYGNKDEYSFSALQEEDARQKAVKVALDRGDTNYVASIQSRNSRIEVLNPSAVRFQRDSYIFLVEKHTVSRSAVRACSFAEAKKFAAQLPDACYKTDGDNIDYYVSDIAAEGVAVQSYTEADIKKLMETGLPQA